MTLRTTIDGEDIRRLFSARRPVTGRGTWASKVRGQVLDLRKRRAQGRGHLASDGPQGRFVLAEGAGKHHVGFAAGSGITPILSQIKDVLSTDPASSYTLFYANKTAASTMFREASKTSRTVTSTVCGCFTS